MSRQIWSPSALADVQRLYRFPTPNDEVAARRAIRAIRAGVTILSHQPEAGRPIEDMEPTFREWVLDFGNSGYIALYHFNGESATILTVRHQREAGY